MKLGEMSRAWQLLHYLLFLLKLTQDLFPHSAGFLPNTCWYLSTKVLLACLAPLCE
jgi:hypothetical protein